MKAEDAETNGQARPQLSTRKVAAGRLAKRCLSGDAI